MKEVPRLYAEVDGAVYEIASSTALTIARDSAALYQFYRNVRSGIETPDPLEIRKKSKPRKTG